MSKVGTVSMVITTVLTALILVIMFVWFTAWKMNVAPKPSVETPASSLEESCYANNNQASCVFTNATALPSIICWKGRITATGMGKQIVSITACARINPYETKEINAPWDRGRPSDVCPSDTMPSVPDWDKCSFDIELVPIQK